ncbi:hypothetical protein Vafri_15275 [Volvox africanus]|uniref:CSC1/OSCA1-like cytosolic domain-containing protein n=1 Tax=Volvox africanus TaxID=51714 RepID=A0A8J4BHD9_9CHLO|nr:hypothetical protein Vafri_15275 [Volvox africanus]
MSGEAGCLGKLRPKYRLSEAVLEEYGHWEPLDEAAARDEYLKSHAHHGVFDVTCHVKELKEFGEGVQMYFFMLKHIAMLFCVLAFLPGLLLAVFNGLGDWYDTADLERTMLGNYGLISHNGAGSDLNLTSAQATSRSISMEGYVTALFASTVDSHPAKMGGMNKRSLLVAMSALDLAGLLAFFGCSMYLMWYVHSRTSSLDASATTIKDYSVRVEGLPPDTSETALKDYLLKATGEGVEIVELELCRCVDHLLALVVERGAVVNENKLTRAMVQRTAEVSPRVPESLIVDMLYSRFLLEELTESIRQEQAFTKTNEVVTAFVTFSTPEGLQRVMQTLPRSFVKQWRMKPESKFNNGGIGGARIKPVALNISAAPEPSDIQYENLEYTRMERVARAIASNAAKYLVLLIGFLLVSLAPAMRLGISGLNSGPDQRQCSASCSYTDGAGSYVLSTENRNLYKGCDPEAGTGALPNKLDCEGQAICYECFCRASLNAGNYGEVVYCSRFSSVMGVYTLAQAVAVIGVVIANFLIEIAITWLVHQEKHHTRTREAVGITRSLFLTTLINTAFSNLVANMYLPGPASVIKGSFLDGYVFTGSFADTTPNWYHDVCRPITISLFLTTVIVHLKIAFRWWWRRRCLATRYQCLTQWQLEEAYTGHEFTLALKYGQHLYVIYVVMMYSSGVPLMYILAAVHFSTCYWSEKYELLRLCRRPLNFSRDLAVYFSSSVPFAALWHLAFSVWFYSLFGLPKSPIIAKALRQSLEHSVAVFKGLMPAASSLTPQLVAWRFTQNSSAHLFIGFIACGGALFIYFTTSTWLALVRGLAKQLGLLNAANDSEAVVQQAVPEFSTAVRSRLLIGPASYAVQQNPAYTHAFVSMEELEWETKKETDAKAAAVNLAYDPFSGFTADPSAAIAAGGDTGAAPPMATRRRNTAANRLRARQKAAAAVSAGATPPLMPSNKVAPMMADSLSPRTSTSQTHPRSSGAPEHRLVAQPQPPFGMQEQAFAVGAGRDVRGDSRQSWTAGKGHQLGQSGPKPPAVAGATPAGGGPKQEFMSAATPAAGNGGPTRGWAGLELQ